jgi:hypothetical protein
MIDEHASVFGVSPGDGSGKGFAFIPVFAVVSDGRLTPIVNPKEAFPTDGNFFVNPDNWLPPRDTPGIWRVRRSREARAGERKAEFSADGRGHPGAFEIIDVAVGSAKPLEVRELLTEGVRIGHVASSPVLVRLTDGTIVGPIRCESLTAPGPPGIFCRSDAFVDLLSRWDEIELLAPFKVPSYKMSRIFSGYLNLPPRSGEYDCATLSEATRIVLKSARVLAAAQPRLTKKQIDAISTALQEVGDAERVQARMPAVKRALTAAASASSESAELMDFLLSQESVMAQLASYRASVRQEELERLVREKAATFEQLKSVQAEVTRATQELVDLQSKAEEKRVLALADADRTVEAVRERIERARQHSVELLSTVELLRPFLVQAIGAPASSALPPAALNLSASPVGGGSEPSPVGSLAELQSRVQQALRTVSILGNAAERLSREVCAALLAGQVPMFRGSLATAVARVCARALGGGGEARRVEIPIGLTESARLLEVFEKTDQESRANGRMAVLLLEGLNVGAVEAYGAGLLARVIERQLTGLPADDSVLVLGTLTDPPSGLPVGESTLALGPVFDTDLLSLAHTPLASPGIDGTLSQANWSGWIGSEKGIAGDSEDVERLCSLAGGGRNVAWRRGVTRAYQTLEQMPHSSSTTLQSLVYGWLLTRMELAARVDDDFLTALNEGKVDGAVADSRIERWEARIRLRQVE